METKQSRNSRLVSLPGLICLLVFALMANYFRLWAVSAFLIICFLLGVSSYVWSRGICRRLEVEAALSDSSCHAGGKTTVKLRVKNKSLFPMVWLDVILPVGEREVVRLPQAKEASYFQFKGKTDPQIGLRQRFVWLLWQQEVIWEQELLANRRGAWVMEGAGLQAGDGFGLSAKEDWKPFSLPVRLMIYPKLVQVNVEPFLKITQEATAGNRGQMEDITILKSSRPYVPGDPVKRVNWRMLARSGQMMINQYEKVLPGCTAFVLDLDTFHYVEEYEDSYGNKMEKKVFDEQNFEEMLSRVASIMRELSDRMLQTALVIPGYKKQDAFFSVPMDGADAGQTLKASMEGLAMIDYHGEEMRFPYEEFWGYAQYVGNFCICTRSGEGTSLEELAQQLGRGRVRFLAVKQAAGGSGEYEWIS